MTGWLARLTARSRRRPDGDEGGEKVPVPSITSERQAWLDQCRKVVPDIGQSIYPFRGVKLTRSDVEWLLATHEGGIGPVEWPQDELNETSRVGLDLRGADLRGEDLRYLPLAYLLGGLDDY